MRGSRRGLCTPLVRRRTVRMAGAVLATFAVVMPAGAQAHGANDFGKKHDFVVGSTKRALLGENAGQDIRLSVVAISGPLGENPFGVIQQKNYTLKTQYGGIVRCLRVNGNVASVGMTVTNSKDPGRKVGDGVIWYFVDYGTPNEANNLDATYSTDPGASIDPTNCPPPPPPFTRPTKSGNYVIHDAQP